MRILALICLLSSLAVPPVANASACRLALVLALDVSGSVNEQEYRQQLNGLAFALNDPLVRSAILDGATPPVHLTVFEWSSRNHQFLVQPWTVLESHAAIDRAIMRIRAYRKQRAGLKTALGTALLFASDLLQEKSHCWQRTVDVSGDGKNNIGLMPPQVYAMNIFQGITVNALVVGDPSSGRSEVRNAETSRNDLRRYFEREVIYGPSAFAMVADGYADYARAMRKKLLRELTVPVLGLSLK